MIVFRVSIILKMILILHCIMLIVELNIVQELMHSFVKYSFN